MINSKINNKQSKKLYKQRKDVLIISLDILRNYLIQNISENLDLIQQFFDYFI